MVLTLAIKAYIQAILEVGEVVAEHADNCAAARLTTRN